MPLIYRGRYGLTDLLKEVLLYFGHKGYIIPPWQKANDPLAFWEIRVGFGKFSHIFHVADRKPFNIGEFQCPVNSIRWVCVH